MLKNIAFFKKKQAALLMSLNTTIFVVCKITYSLTKCIRYLYYNTLKAGLAGIPNIFNLVFSHYIHKMFWDIRMTPLHPPRKNTLAIVQQYLKCIYYRLFYCVFLLLNPFSFSLDAHDELWWEEDCFFCNWVIFRRNKFLNKLNSCGFNWMYL